MQLKLTNFMKKVKVKIVRLPKELQGKEVVDVVTGKTVKLEEGATLSVSGKMANVLVRYKCAIFV